jgi:hypothetical protein
MARYKFLNLNPLGLREQDCVCRAISLALNEDYFTIERKLELVGELFECEQLCVCCYKFLLDNVYNLDRIEECQGMTVNEFADFFPQGIYIIRVDGHCTCVIDNQLLDVWNCGNEIVDIVWKVQ